MRQAWLNSLVPGDEVAIGISSSQRYRIAEVTAVHKLHVVVGQTKYRKRDGRCVGDDTWHWTYITEPTDAIREKIERANLLDVVQSTRWTSVPTEKLRTIRDLLKEIPK